MYLCAGVYLCVRSYPGLTETQLDVAHALVPNLNAEMSNFCVCMRAVETAATTNKIHINYIHSVLSLFLLSAITLRRAVFVTFFLISLGFVSSAFPFVLALHLN